MLPKSTEVTGLLKAWSGGDEAALERLTDRVYDELRRIARRYMRNERADNTLQTTALVNEAYLRPVDVKGIEWQQRAQFFGLVAQLMRRILVDAARARGAQKRGRGAIQVNMDEALVPSPGRYASLVALDEALEVFSKLAERQAKLQRPPFSEALRTPPHRLTAPAWLYFADLAASAPSHPGKIARSRMAF